MRALRFLGVLAALMVFATAIHAYVEAPMSLGAVIAQSTSYPGTTNEVIRPVLELMLRPGGRFLRHGAGRTHG